MLTARSAAAGLLCVLLAAGCGGSSDKHATPSASTDEPACAPSTDGTDVQSSPALGDTMFLTGLAAAREPCADRVTFDFRPDLPGKPGFRIEYRPASEAQTEDGSGRHVEVAGSAFLVVRFEPAATADLSGDQLEFTYKGPRRVAGDGTRHVREVVKTGDFESVLTWTIGLDEKRPFKVVTSDSPPRLALEIG
jgi:hypothetical protein